MSEVLDEIETQLEAVEDVVDLEAIVEKVNPRLVFVATGAAALVAGAVGGYFLAVRVLKPRYQKIADEQVAEVVSHYAQTIPEKPSLQEMREHVAAEMRADQRVVESIADDRGYVAYDKVHQTPKETIIREDLAMVPSVATPEREIHNVFDNVDEYFDVDREMRRREEFPNDPFVITEDEFGDNEHDYEQLQVTYYEGDGVLADENDVKIDDLDAMVGIENMLRFGHGSESKDIVFVRNNRIKADIEVARATEAFAVAVLGYLPEQIDTSNSLKHSDSFRRNRGRSDDD